MIPKIYGFNKTSEAGLNVFSPSVFVQGCNLQCPFCFNSVLAKSKMKEKDVISLDIVDSFLDEEKPDMVMISGGEPLMLKNLVELVDHFTSKGLKIGLSTHGIFNNALKNLLPRLHYVAMDIKSSDPKVYKDLDLIPDNDSFNNMLDSKEALFQNKKSRSDFDYEVRTSLYPVYVNINTIHEIGKFISNEERWVLQQYRPTKNLYNMELTKNIKPYDFDELQLILEAARKYTKDSYLRYV